MSSPPTFTERAAAVEKMLTVDPIIRTVNFHSTSRARSADFERQLALYSRHFTSVNQDELDGYVRTGRWHKPKPGLIVAVYEGYRNGYDVLAPLLERYGFVGWFFLITGFLNAQVADQEAFAKAHRIGMQTRDYPDGRYALSWEEVRKLDAKHVIASHTRSHTRLAALDSVTLEREVIGAQEDIETHLGHKARAFSSLTGPPHGEYPATDRLVEAAGYDFIFSNFSIQRVHAKS